MHGDTDGQAEVPVTTVPIFLYLQPVLAPLSIPEPPLLMSETEAKSEPKKHLHFILTLHDPVHSLRFTSVSQPTPADWLEVEYERSDWVEERLVHVLRVGVEVVAQDVSTGAILFVYLGLFALEVLTSEADNRLAFGQWRRVIAARLAKVDSADMQYVATRMGLKTSAADKAAVAASLSADAATPADAIDSKRD